MIKLSEHTWHKSKDVILAIKNHPFNIQLAMGNLAIDKFSYYIEQDTLYLQEFARSLALIAARAPLSFLRDFLSFSEGALVAEQESVHRFFRENFNLKKTGKLTPATLSYTSYLLQTCHNAPVEVAIASVLPCFWVYREVGLSIVKDTKEKNPYWRWIETYSGEKFGQGVERAIDIFDKVASEASENIKNQMLEAFYKSTVLEWHFWNDAYHKTVFDGFIFN